MKVKELLQMIEDNPEIAEYDLNLAEYFSVPDSYLTDDADISEEDIQIVVDFPIRAIATNDDSKELRFIMTQSDFSTIEQCPDRILKILKDKFKGTENAD